MRGRGLKLGSVEERIGAIGVAPRAGARIETLGSDVINGRLMVPHADDDGSIEGGVGLSVAASRRLAQRDPAFTQRTGLHDVTPCHRRRPLGSAGVGLAVLQSANLCG